MKITSLIKKTALAAAVASISYGVSAADMTVTPAGSVPAVATEFFAKNAAGVDYKVPTLTIADARINPSPSLTNSIKFILEGDAVFKTVPEEVTAGNKAADLSGAGVSARRVAGGTGQGFVTYELEGKDGVTFNGPFTLDPADAIVLEKVKGAVSIAVELDNSYETDKTSATILTSEPATKVGHKATSYTVKADASAGEVERARIQVADDQYKFTAETGSGASSDFSQEDAQQTVWLGAVTLEEGTGTKKIASETAADVVYTAATVKYTLSAGDASIKPYGKVFLNTDTTRNNCDATGGIELVFVDGENSYTGEIANTNLSTPVSYELCATVAADNADRIPEAHFSLTANIKVEADLAASPAATKDFEKVLMNGCQVSLFNVPNLEEADKAFIRFTNTSDFDGVVRARMINQDGSTIVNGQEVLTELKSQATAVFHTNKASATNGTFVNLGDISEFAALTSGRHRLELSGAFPSCEALGIINTNGVLVNMSATTASND